MTQNIGTADRAARILLGLALLAMALFATDVPYSYLGWIGFIPIATAFAGVCPLYSLLGFRTCPTKTG